MGLLVATWTRRRGMKPLWDNIKIFAGTGFLGAFTTYSTFALAMASATMQARFAALGVGLGVVAAGVLGAWLGMRLGSGSKRAMDEGGEHS